MQASKHLGRFIVSLVAAGALLPMSASAVEFDLKGSLGEAGFTHYVSPVSNPLFNETPYITTELRPVWVHQAIPEHFLTDGGNIDAIAAQIRVALTDRLGFIATKSGWADIDFDELLDDEDGAVNLAFGFKYALLAEPESNSLITVALKYEAPSGSLKIEPVDIKLQGQGDGLFDVNVAGARTFGPVGLEAGIGTQIAVDGDKDVSFLHYAVHADYDVIGRIFPLLELNGYTPIHDADRTSLGVNGMDLVNMGSDNAKTVVTVAPGVRVRLIDNVDLGFAFEVPITEANDLMDWRTTMDLVVHL